MAEKSGGSGRITAGELFGQKRPPLYETIKNILRDYPSGQIFKEIIQNADDARATEVKFFLDCRKLQPLPHDTSEEHKLKFTSPALLSYNNAPFEKEDWESIQSLQQSGKATNPHKVGKFGIGFNSVYHITDLPVILSQNYCGFLEPQEEVWRGESGKGFYLESLNRTYPDVLKPFDNICGFTRGHATFNNQTFLRFPLRTKPSKLSSDSYTIDKLRALLQPLKEEAKYLLLFLRSVTSIEVLEINDRNVAAPKCIFKVNIVSQEQIMLQKQQLVRKVESRFTTPYINACHVIKDTANFSVTIFDGRKRSSHNWLVINQIGSNERSVMKLAEEQHVLPWVGTAFEIDSRKADPNGRIFCVLPLPVEDRAPLSVHINGTFAVTSNRRSLKWESQERKEDKESKWNTILVEKCLPTCLVELVNQLIQLCRSDPAIVYSCWPDVSSVSSTPWRGVLEPFYQSLLMSDGVVHSVRGGSNWISAREGVYINSSECVPQPVIDAMISCNVNIVKLSNKCQVALRRYYGAVNILHPRIARSYLKRNPRSYNSLPDADKLAILDYCLSDDAFNDLNGLELLPMANNSFQQFSQPTRYYTLLNYAYICSKHIPSTLLPELQHILVSMSSTNIQLHDKLVEVASSRHTHVKVLSVSLVADLLSHCYTSSWSQEQLKLFWQWLSQNELQYFSHKHTVPVTLPSGHTVIKPLSKQDGVVYIPQNFYHSELLVSGLHKCGIKFADARHFSYLVHRQICKYLYQFRANDVIDALKSFNLSQVRFTDEEAQEIQKLICSCSNLTQSRINTICSLAIFSIIQESTRYSINSIKTPPYARYKAICIKLSGLDKYQLPNSPLLIDGDANNDSLLSLFHSVISHLSTIDYLLTVAFPQIRNNHFGYEKVVNFMKNVLELFSTFQYSNNFSQLNSAISSLPFIDVGDARTYLFRAPEDLFDPNNAMLRKLFQNEQFPSSDFKSHVFILRNYCNLKSIDSVTASDIYEVIGSIKQQSSIAPTNKTDYAKAIAVLDFLTKYPSTLNQNVFYNFQLMPLLNALINERQCWLPVVKDRPRNYPSCLSWNGSLSLVSSDYNPLYALPSSIESDSLPMIGGSQIIFIQNVPHQIVQYICSPSSILTKAVVSHFKHIIDNEDEIPSETLEQLSMKTYSYLQDNIAYISTDIFDETNKWVWLEKSSMFVDTSQVVIRACSSFRTSLEPLLFVLPSRWHKFNSLFTKLGVSNKMTVRKIVSILSIIRNSPNTITPNEAWSIVRAILNWLTEEPSRLHEANDVLVPIESDSEYPDLQPIDTVAYTDNEVLANIASLSDEDYSLIHSNVAHLGAPLCLTPLSDYLDITEDVFEDAGQHEPLTTRLANILKEYKDGLTIIKEMIQNADDAEATEINILYDSRSHTTQNLLFKDMGDSHGPALIVHNNSTFNDEDFVNITKLAGATKSNKPLKIGKFGVGFCSVYHITDVPSFISREWLYIFDPTLQYLKGIIRNENQPGKKVKYMSKITSKSKQLAPYENIFNFKSSEVYNGTIFRFPFRIHPSQISSTKYNEYLVSQLKEDLKENGSKLLLFLQNIKRITFSTISVHGTVMEELSIQCITNGDIKQCITRVPSSEPMTEYWLVSCHNGNFQTANGIQPGTGSVACELSLVDGIFECKKVDGSLFCFLPLSIPSTGLPVHVNGNFAVMSNRSGIWTSATSGVPSDSKEKWNLMLLKEIIPKAYCDLLLKLKSSSSSGVIRSYTFHSLWPLDIELRMRYPWEILTSELYKILSKKKLFHSKSTDKWLNLNECKFLSPELFRGINIINDDGTCINEAVINLQLPIVSLPLSYQKQLNIYPDMVMDQEMFIRSFLSNINIFNANIKIRNQVLLHMLSWIVTVNEDSTLMELIKAFPCIPCCPEGVELKSVYELLDPCIFNDMFDSSDGMFPVSSFMRNNFIHRAMISLGLLQSDITSEIIVKCAESVYEVFNNDSKRGIKRIKLLISCIKEQRSDLCFLLKDIPFLPVLPKPKNFFLPWKGDGHDLLPPSQVIAVTSPDNLWKCSVTVGSQKAIVNTTSEGGCGLINYKVLSLLNIPIRPSLDDVISHFQCLINHFEIKMCESSDKIRQIDTICRNVYEFLDKGLPNEISHGQYYSSKLYRDAQVPAATLSYKQKLSVFFDKQFIWTGKGFVAPNNVSKEWNKCDGPCLYKLPSLISDCNALLEVLNIKDKFDFHKLFDTFRNLYEKFNSQVLSSEYHNLCDGILTELSTLELSDDDIKSCNNVYLVDTKYILRLSTDLLYNDTQWLDIPKTAESHFVPSHLSREIAIKLGVKPTRSRFLKQYTSSTQHFGGYSFGQNEKITDRIKNIIRDYPFDITFLKELIQNADDAKATKMYVILDKRQHGTERILSEEWKELQGPAILVWNDKNFTDKDIEGIQKLGVGSKRDDDESIGQFGIGFNVVYHVTDCPSFITRGNTLCVFDPHCHYVPGADPQCPGRQYDIDESFWESMPDLRAAYLQDYLPNKPLGLNSGVLFRFPLRCTDQSHISSTPVTASSIHGILLYKWIPQIKETLLFVNNLTQFEVYIIDQLCKYNKIANFSVSLTDVDNQKRKNFKEVCSDFKVTRECKQIMYQLSISTNDNVKEEQWLILQGVGNPSSETTFINQSVPKHGLAAPLNNTVNFKGKAFCLLPLPIDTNLPVHINGQFVLNNNRRSLWSSSSEELDSKTQWNNNLFEAIAYSYADFLCKAKEYYMLKKYEKVEHFDSDANHYYSLFPYVKEKESNLPLTLSKFSKTSPRRIRKQDWNGISKLVYEKLWAMNAPVLLCKIIYQSKFIAQWHVLHDDYYQHNQAHFLPKIELDEDLQLILKYIGMKLTCAPYTLYKHLKEFEPAIVSPQSVCQYYKQFHQLIIREFPCSIKNTPFTSAAEFCVFLDYLCVIKHDEKVIQYSFPSELENIPLLLTADFQLRGFDSSKTVLMSNYWHLFKKSLDKFLHPTVMQYCPKLPSYYFASEDTTLLHDINTIMETNYQQLDKTCIVNQPVVVCNEVLSDLWECLHNDPVFKSNRDEILKKWALIPSCDQRLFNCSSLILPIVEDTDTIALYQKTFEVLISFNFPQLNNSIVVGAENYCFDLANDHKRVLSALYHLHNLQNIVIQSPAAIAILFEYFGKINFKNDKESLCYIKNLPLFLTAITNEYTCIDGKDLYVWPTGFCGAGYDIWAPTSSRVFLKSDGDWKILCDSIETLGGQNIDERGIYMKFIFPIFHALQYEEKSLHLDYIKTSIHHEVMFEIELKNQQRKKLAEEFLSELKTLKWIQLKSGKLANVAFFCNEKIPIFVTFDDFFDFLPEIYQSTEWTEFLCDLGLKQTVTVDEFTNLCNLVNSGKHENTVRASKVLVEYLFSKSAKEWHTKGINKQKLKEIGNVCCAQVIPCEEFHCIKQFCQPTFYLSHERIGFAKLNEAVIKTTFNINGCLISTTALIWTVKPVVDLPCMEYIEEELQNYDADPDLYCAAVRRNFLEGIGLTIEPSIEDVYQNLINISENELSNFNLFSKYGLTNKSHEHISFVIIQCLNYLFTKDAHELLKQLSNVPCIPVSADGSSDWQPVLVKPLQVIKHICNDCNILFPYIHQLPSSLTHTVKSDILRLIGISDNLAIEPLQHMLQLMHEQYPNTKLHANDIKRVRKAILKIHEILKNNQHNNEKPVNLPLYYSNEYMVLKDTTELIYIDDLRKYKDFQNDDFLGYLFKLPYDDDGDDEDIPKIKDICLRLPEVVRPKCLSLVCTEVLVTDTESTSDDCPLSLHFNKFKKILPSLEKYLFKVLVVKGFDHESATEFFSFLVRLVETVKIKVMHPLLCVVKLHDHELGTINIPCLLKEDESDFVLFVDFNAAPVFTSFKKLAHALCSLFTHVKVQFQIPVLKEILCDFLKITCNEDMEEILDKYKLDYEDSSDCITSTTFNDDCTPDCTPALNERIPTNWVSVEIGHTFYPEEWVGFELSKGYIVFAIVQYIVENNANALLKKYQIYFNDSETGKREVTALDLYKVMKKDCHVKISSESFNNENLMNSLSTAEQKKVCDIVQMIQQLENEHDIRKRALYRLFLTYYPDKKFSVKQDLLDIFLVLKAQVQRKEVADCDSQSYRPSRKRHIKPHEYIPSFLPDLNSNEDIAIIDHEMDIQNKLENTQDKVEDFQDKTVEDYNQHPSSSPLEQILTVDDKVQPQANVKIAEEWILQSESDMKAMKELMKLDDLPCCQVLFLAHETCEKALKAGKYAHFGLNSVSLKSHELNTHALALSTVSRELSELPMLVCSEDYYLDTRFPNRFDPQCAPVSKKTLMDKSEAQKISSNAEEVVKRIRKFVEEKKTSAL